VNIPVFREEMIQRFGASGFRGGTAKEIQARRDRYCPWDVPRTEDEPLPYGAEGTVPAPEEPKRAANS
jgi:hypothetical protein